MRYGWEREEEMCMVEVRVGKGGGDVHGCGTGGKGRRRCVWLRYGLEREEAMCMVEVRVGKGGGDVHG